MKRSRFVLIAVLVVVFMATARVAKTGRELEFPAPQKPLYKIGNAIFCAAIIGSTLEAYTGVSSKKCIRGNLFKGTDQVAIEVEGDALYFTTKAAFEAGQVRDKSPFKVLVNSESQLVAIDYDESLGAYINVFALNRRTGIAVWSKSRSRDFLTGNPDVQSYILSCEPR